MNRPLKLAAILSLWMGATACGLTQEEPDQFTPQWLTENAREVDWATDTALACNELWNGNSTIYRWERQSNPEILFVFLYAAWTACREDPEYAVYLVNIELEARASPVRMDITDDGWIFLQNSPAGE